MAAIDKLWLEDYNDLSLLRSWALAYYPKLFVWLNIDYTQETFVKAQRELANRYKRTATTQWKKVSLDGTLNSAIAHYISIGYTEEEARLESEQIYDTYITSIDDMYEEIELSVMNVPSYIDRKLKWICPLHCIRRYLKNQCGVKTRWYHKIFWRGKKYFKYL